MKYKNTAPLSYMYHPHEDFDLELDDIARNAGCNVEVHWTTTEDGYINKLYRINKFDQQKLNDSSRKPSVLLLHGLLDSGDSFFINGHNKSIGFVMANAGYDVWVGNSRGNKHSEGHLTLDADTDKEYWENVIPDYMALYDIPAFIEKAKEISKLDKIAVISHSMGGHQMFVNLQLNSTYFK